MKSKILAICLAVLMIAAVFTVYIVADKAPAIQDAMNVELNADNIGDGIYYTLDDNTQTAIVGKNVYAEHNTSGLADRDNIIIPDTVTKGGTTYVVREIGRNAFDGASVREVVILNNVTRIGEFAFADCVNLERVAMGSGVTEIAGFAFWYCPNLVDVCLGANVKTIGGCAFWGDVSLEYITIPQGATEIMSEAFKDCAALKLVIKADTTTIADNAFDGIETAPTVSSDYTPAIYVPTVYAAAGETVNFRLLLEGNAGGAAIPTEFKLNGVDRQLTELGGVEIGDTAYNGTVFLFGEPVEGEKNYEVQYNGKTSTGAINACDHAETKDLITVAPTCTEAGEKVTVCTKCHEAIGEPTAVEALGHDYVDFVIEAVCLDGGYTTHKCSRCGDLYKDAETDPTGHNYNSYVISSMPTHSATGVKKETCGTCKRVESIVLPIVGDVNGDEKRNARDVTAVMKYIVNKGAEEGATFFEESANCDGKLVDGVIKINARDVTALMKAIVDENIVLPSTPVPTATAD